MMGCIYGLNQAGRAERARGRGAELVSFWRVAGELVVGLWWACGVSLVGLWCVAGGLVVGRW